MSSLLFLAKKHSSHMVAHNTDGNPPDRPVAGYLKTRLLQLTFTRSAKVSARKATAVLNSAARIIACTPRHEHISEIRMQLHWLPIQQRIRYKILLLAFLVVHGKAPEYLSELLVLHKPNRALRSVNQPIFKQPRSFTKTFGNRAFVIAAPKLWNSLPTLLRDIHDLKLSLKTYLYLFE